MFERYTEKARRSIFFARYEASVFGSPYIEELHLLLGITREERSLLTDVIPSAIFSEALRKWVEAQFPPGEKTSTSVDLPLSAACRRALQIAADEATRLGHENITCAHLLLGLISLPESKSLAALLAMGANTVSLRGSLEVAAEGKSVATDPATKSLREKVLDNLRAKASVRSTTRQEGNTTVTETIRNIEGCEFIVTQRWTLSDDKKKVTYSHEIAGKTKTEKHETEFEL